MIKTGCLLSGLPKDIEESELKSYLQRFPATSVLNIQRDKRSCNAVLQLASKKSLQRLKVYARKTALRDRFPSCCKFHIDEMNQIVVDDKKKKKRATTGKKSTREDQVTRMVNELASRFHTHLCLQPKLVEKSADREHAGKVFQQFVENGEVDVNINKHRVEALVMAKLRQKKLLRSYRAAGKVIMVFANAVGEFPTVQEQVNAREKVLQLRREEESDKNGVQICTLSEITVGSGESSIFKLNVSVSEESRPLILRDVEIRGPHRNVFKLDGTIAKVSMRDSFGPVVVTATPRYVGVYRASLYFHFVKDEEVFVIVRELKVRCATNKGIDKALAPTTPYVPPKWSRAVKHKAVFNPPQEKNIGQNPFKNLPQNRIPNEIKELIIANEIENVVQPPIDDGVSGYSVFWKTMLWASEFQATKDIQLYDMKDVTLQRNGRYLNLTVPGLAESRPSVLRGDAVDISWKGNLYKGRVERVEQLEVVMSFHESFHRNYNPALDSVDVRFTFSRMTFRICHEASKIAEHSLGKSVLYPSDADIATGSFSFSRSPPKVWNWANRGLNDEQKEAVRNIIVGHALPIPYIIFGPPGTGKTTTVVEAVYQLAKLPNKPKILLVAPSNEAADVLVERLSAYFPPSELNRVVAFSRSIETVPQSIRQYTTELNSTPGKAELIKSGCIVVSTVNLAARFSYLGIPKGFFEILCVDEAGHVTEPEVISVASNLIDFNVASSLRGQMILAGDPKQLGPIITSEICRKFGMAVSYMERLSQLKLYSRSADGSYPAKCITKLLRNYRSHPSILKLPNEMFYDGDLECWGDQMQTHSLTKWEYLPTKGFPVLFHAVTGENLREGNSPSWFNPQEAQIVADYVRLLKSETKPKLTAEDIGIITPYHRQVQKIRRALELSGIHDIKVGSVEVFQGQERRCIIVSTVRAEEDHIPVDLRYNLGFVANPKRFNVAVTRAKSLLIVVGCPQVLALDKENWLPFLRYCLEHKSWVGEEWIPSISSDSDSESANLEDEFNWDLVDLDANVPSQMTQEAFGFVKLEEL